MKSLFGKIRKILQKDYKITKDGKNLILFERENGVFIEVQLLISGEKFFIFYEKTLLEISSKKYNRFLKHLRDGFSVYIQIFEP